MVIDNNKTIAPLQIEEVATVLQVNSTDLGYLCSNKHGKINKYSRKKPVMIQGDDVNLTQPNTWWKGENLQCGLNIPYRTAITSNINDYFDGSMKWGYDAPTPNSKYPARLLDFDGYYHNAINPITTENMPTDVFLEANYGGVTLRFSLDVSTEGDDYNLGLKDIDIKQITGVSQHIIDWYPGLIFKSKDKNDFFAKTTTSPLNSGSFDIEIKGSNERLQGQWNVIPFLSTIQVDTYTGTDKAGYYISADVDAIDITIHGVGKLTYGWLVAQFVNSHDYPKHRYVSYYGSIINSRTSSETFDVTLYIGYTPDGRHPLKGGVLTNVKHLNLGEVFVPAAESTAEEDKVYVSIASNNFEDGKYDYLDIGTTYAPDQENTPNAVYWVFIGFSTTVNGITTTQPIPYESYQPLEESAPEDEEMQEEQYDEK